MKPENLYALPFASVYPHYVKKAEAKGRTKEELDEIIRWLTGYTRAGCRNPLRQRGASSPRVRQLTGRPLTQAVLTKAPKWNPNAHLITGTVCGIRVENIEDPLMQKTPIPRQTRRRTRERQAYGEDFAEGVALEASKII